MPQRSPFSATEMEGKDKEKQFISEEHSPEVSQMNITPHWSECHNITTHIAAR